MPANRRSANPNAAIRARRPWRPGRPATGSTPSTCRDLIRAGRAPELERRFDGLIHARGAAREAACAFRPPMVALGMPAVAADGAIRRQFPTLPFDGKSDHSSDTAA